MDVKDLKNKLYDAVHDDLYVNRNKDIEIENEIINYLYNSKNYFDDLRIIISGRNNENYYCYDRYINNIVVESPTMVKLDILNSQELYNDIIRLNNTYLDIFLSLSNQDRFNYLSKKKRYTSLDYYLINSMINNNIELLFEIIKKDNILSKIDINSIDIDYNNKLLDINLEDYSICKIFSKSLFTTLLLKKYPSFLDFKKLYDKNNNIYNLINSNSLVFHDHFNENIYDFIKDNNKFIGKYNNKYLDLFSIKEINEFKNNKEIDSDSYSSIIQKLYLFDKDKVNDYFNEDVLRNCSKHSIYVSPFDNMDSTLRDKIFDDYSLFNKFIDTIMIETMNNYFIEDNIVNMLRDDNFVNDISSFAMELLLNKLSFKNVFNMLQRKNILDKINHLNTKIVETDNVFVKGFLDSPTLLYKSNHNMVYNMLNVLIEKDFNYYIYLPYVLENLSNNEIIDLCLNKNINIDDFVNSKSILEKLNTSDLINYINRYFEDDVDLRIFSNNKKLCELIFNLTPEQVDVINFNEVNYLYETIRTKGMLSKQKCSVDVLSYKAVLSAYLVFGLNDTLKLIDNGNKDITLEEVKDLENSIIQEKLLLYREDNAPLFQNMMKEVLEELDEVGSHDDINVFEEEIRKNTYLDNIIFMMLDNNYDTYNNIIKRLYSFVKYSSYGEFDSKKELYEYIKGFSNKLISNKEEEYVNEFNKIIINNFKVKENVIYNERKNIGREYLKKLKFKIFVRSLTDNNSSDYKCFYKDEYDISNLKDDYLKSIGKSVEFDNILDHILYPIANNRFDIENCLSKLDIRKPDNYDNYYTNLNNMKLVTKLNEEIEQYKYLFTQEEFLSIMNYICYGNRIRFRIKTKIKNAFKKLQEIANNIDGEIYVDKSTMKYIYNDNKDIYNVDEIVEYNNYLKIIEGIIRKTELFINKNMDDIKIISCYSSEYFNHINSENKVFPITNRYYEPRRRVFSLKDIVHIFNGYNLSNFTRISTSLYNFLFNKKNIVMYAEGYYNGIVDNLGLIMSKWNYINEYAYDLGIEKDSLSLIKAEQVLSLINYNNNIISQSLSRDIIKGIYSESYYEVFDLNRRIDILSDLYKESYKKVRLSIPYITVNDDCYTIKVIDKYNQDMYRTFNHSVYKVGMIGNDLLHYSILSDNGFKIGVYKHDKLIGNAIGIRNGNSVFINILEGEDNKNYNSLFKQFANRLIEVTKDDIQKIEFVLMVNNELLNDKNSVIIDSTICDIVNYPLYEYSKEYEEFKNNKNLLNIDKNIYTNYGDNVTILLASSNIVDKKNFRYYNPDNKYLRVRNQVMKLSTNIGEDYLKIIDNIILLCKEKDNTLNTDLSLSMVDTIFLGDDYVLFITEKKNIIKYVLDYDDRVTREVQLVLNSLDEKV